jgi:DnaJ-class molecular chaperone
MNLVPAIREISNQITQIEARHAAELKPYIDSLASIRSLNKACEACGGSGKVMRPRACAEDDRERDLVNCAECHGTGLRLIGQEEQR